jgi:hypothetical protein
MSIKIKTGPLALALGTAMTTTLAGSGAAAGENPFTLKPLPGGAHLLAEAQPAAAGGMEGRCGMREMDADGDGRLTREEFIQGHEAMFSVIDANGDGVIDAQERRAHMGMRKGCGMEGKCGGAQ